MPPGGEMRKEATFRLADGVRESSLGRLALRSGVTAVAVLDAAELVGEYEVFEALNDQFRFPVYFGWNWDAVYDCLSDLTWIPADRYIVVIENAEHLDVSADHPHGLLVEALQRAARSLSSHVRREPMEFTVLLSRSTDEDLVARRFRAAGIHLETA